MKKLVIFILLLFESSLVFSQDVENLFKTNPLKINGGLSINTMFNHSTNPKSHRTPFQYTFSGFANFSFLEWSIPFNYSISNGSSNANYSIPTILALHPKYKWIQLHVGYNMSSSFSPYTLAGQTYSGLGLDLSPKGAFKLSILGGRLIKAIDYDSVNNIRPFYNRYGGGFKVGLNTKPINFSINSLYAEDDIKSQPQVYEAINVLPKRNFAAGLEFSTGFSSLISFNGEVAFSLMNQDIRAPRNNSYGFLGNLVKSNSATQLYKAIKFNSVFSAKVFVFGVGFERIDPNYTAMGALNYNNDYQNINANLAIPLFNNKVKLATSIGYQTDNLDDQKENKTGRVVSAINTQLNLSKKLNINASVSNFNSLTQINPYNNSLNNTPYNPDSLKFQITNFNSNLGINYQIANSSSATHSINNQTTYTKNTSERGNSNLPSTKNLNNNTSYSLSLNKSKVNLGTSFNINSMQMDTNRTLNMAAMFTASKPFNINKEPLKTNLSFMYNISNSNQQEKTNVISLRANASYTLLKKHNFMFSLGNTFVSQTKSSPSSMEVIASFNYSYSFSVFEPKSKSTP